MLQNALQKAFIQIVKLIYSEQEKPNLNPQNVAVCCLQEKPKMFAKGTEINVPVVVKKLNEILQARGKKGTDR